MSIESIEMVLFGPAVTRDVVCRYSERPSLLGRLEASTHTVQHRCEWRRTTHTDPGPAHVAAPAGARRLPGA